MRLEISAYKAEPLLPRVKRMIPTANGGTKPEYNDPLLWWKSHEHKYPMLAALARRTLCIPATSAPSERLFSTAGLTIANDRARLLPANARALIFLHDVMPVLRDILPHG